MTEQKNFIVDLTIKTKEPKTESEIYQIVKNQLSEDIPENPIEKAQITRTEEVV